MDKSVEKHFRGFKLRLQPIQISKKIFFFNFLMKHTFTFMTRSTHATLYSGEQVGQKQLVTDHYIVNVPFFEPSVIEQLLVPYCFKRTTEAASPSTPIATKIQFRGPLGTLNEFVEMQAEISSGFRRMEQHHIYLMLTVSGCSASSKTV